MSDDTEKGPSLGEVVSGAAFGVGVVTAWLYGAGWTYAYYYFDRFRIPLLMTELPREHLLVYGGLTLQKNLLASGAVVVVLTALVAAAVRLRRRIGRGWLVGLALLVLAVLFALARQAGVHTAYADYAAQREADYSAYPRIVVEPARAAPNGTASQSLEMAASGCARLILFTRERLFFVRPRRDAPALELHTHVVPWRQVASMTITDRYDSCP